VQFLPPLGNRVRVHARGPRDGLIAASPNPQRFEGGKQTPLPFIQQAHEKRDGGEGILGACCRFAPHGKRRTPGRAKRSRPNLLPPSLGIRGAIEVQARNLLARQTALPRQLEKRPFHRHRQFRRQFRGEPAALAPLHPRRHRLHQRAPTREVHPAAIPQTPRVEPDPFAQRIIAPPMRVARKVIERPQLAKDPDIRLRAQRLLQFAEGGYAVPMKKANNRIGRVIFGAHYDRPPPV